MTTIPHATIAKARAEAIATRLGMSGHKMALDAFDTANGSTGALTHLASETGHPVIPEIRPDYDTASWSFDGTSHRVALGENFAAAIQKIPTGTRVQQRSAVQEFAQQLLRHEAWHGRITHRDLRAVASECKSKRVPFVLFNLFEDARIEEVARHREKRGFGWSRWLNTTHVAKEPLEAFYCQVVLERPGLMLDTLAPDPATGKPRFTGEQDRKVREFYERATRASSTLQIIDLCAEWMAYWRSDEGGERKDGGTVARPGTVPTLKDGVGEEWDGSAGEAREEGAKAQAEDDSRKAGPGHRIVTGSSDAMAASTRMPFSHYQEGSSEPMDRQAVARLAQRLDGVIVASASRSTARLASSGSRLHIPALASQSESAFRAPGKRGGTPTFCIVVDMSGSMSAEWDRHGRLFTAAMLRLLREGRINGSVILTGGDSHAIVPSTITDRDFDRLRPSKRNETIAATLEACREMVTAAHFTVVYTDAQITDGSVDAKRWRMRGVELVGACIVPKDEGYDRTAIVGAMRTHFGNSVMAATGEALALALVSKLGNLAASK